MRVKSGLAYTLIYTPRLPTSAVQRSKNQSSSDRFSGCQKGGECESCLDFVHTRRWSGNCIWLHQTDTLNLYGLAWVHFTELVSDYVYSETLWWKMRPPVRLMAGLTWPGETSRSWMLRPLIHHWALRNKGSVFSLSVELLLLSSAASPYGCILEAPLAR